MIHDEERRLRRAIRRAILLACGAPAGAFAACSSDEPSTAPAPDAALDSTPAPDAAAISDAGLDCQSSAPYFIDASYVMVGDANCFYFVDFPCGNSYQPLDDADCYLFAKDCVSACTLDGAAVFDCQYWPGFGCSGGVVDVQPGQPTKVACGVCAGVGRRPAGLVRPPAVRTANVLGGYFARAAYLEAASVRAFERLGRELRAHGAPKELVQAAEQSIRDEVRHTRAMTRLAHRYGGSPAPVRIRHQGVRSLGRVALENATEGCVRETFGAVVATWQATRARDPEVRQVMRRIARDETRHAAIAWSVARWADESLDGEGRARVAQARQAELATIRKEVVAPPDPVLVREAGLPHAADARRLLDGCFGHVFPSA